MKISQLGGIQIFSVSAREPVAFLVLAFQIEYIRRICPEEKALWVAWRYNAELGLNNYIRWPAETLCEIIGSALISAQRSPLAFGKSWIVPCQDSFQTGTHIHIHL